MPRIKANWSAERHALLPYGPETSRALLDLGLTVGNLAVCEDSSSGLHAQLFAPQRFLNLDAVEQCFRESRPAAIAQESVLLFSLHGLVELAEKGFHGFHFDMNYLSELTSFEDLRNCYHTHVFNPSTFPFKHAIMNAAISGGEASQVNFLSAILGKMVELHPERSLDYCLNDPYLLNKFSDAGLAKDPRFNPIPSVEEMKANPPQGVVMLPTSKSRLREIPLASALILALLERYALTRKDSIFFAVDVSKLPLHLLAKLSIVFVPTKDFVASANLLLVLADRAVDEFETSEVGVSFKAIADSLAAAVKAHEALVL